MNILIVDNNDSFTYNIVEVIRTITDDSIHVVPSREVNLQSIEAYERIIISPGPGLPAEFPVLPKILNMYVHTKPILGICLGHQAICDFFGAKLINLPSVVHGQSRLFSKEYESILFKNIPHSFRIGLYHSWIVDRQSLPDSLSITGTSDDGYIMAVEHKTYKLFGVQFHPESFITQYGSQIIENFINI
jgi:anthranilate synthase/aminodeoxychorismate synthase-like glutamine amidotransferase